MTHTFSEAVVYLNAGNFIDYEVTIGKHHGGLMTRENWLDAVESKVFIDYDGMGHEIDENGNILTNTWLWPSQAIRILPETK